MDPAKAKRLITKLFELFYFHLYHRLAWSYDLVAAAVSFGRWKDWTYAITSELTGDSFLELGFGPGHLLAKLVSSGKRVVGIDESAQMCRLAKLRLARINMPGHIIRADFASIPLPSHIFDTVFATFPSPYIFRQETLAEIQRLVKSRGMLQILLAAQTQGKTFPDRIIQLLFSLSGESIPPPAVLHTLTETLRENGFKPTFRWLHFHTDRLLLISATPLKNNHEFTLDFRHETD